MKLSLARWNIKHERLHSPEMQHRVHVVCLNTGSSTYNVIREASDLIYQMLEFHRVKTHQRSIYLLDNYDSALRHFIEVSACTPIDCTVVLLPDAESLYSYSTIKSIADFVGRHLVCVKANKLGRIVKTANKEEFHENRELASNLVLKINIKFRGENHRIRTTLLISAFGLGILPVVVMGADVAHPSPTARDGCPSIASVVATANYHFMRYKGSMRLQAGRQEKIEDM